MKKAIFFFPASEKKGMINCLQNRGSGLWKRRKLEFLLDEVFGIASRCLLTYYIMRNRRSSAAIRVQMGYGVVQVEKVNDILWQ